MSSDVIRSVVQTDYNNPRQLPTGGEWGIAIVWPDKATAGDRWGINGPCGCIPRGQLGYFTIESEMSHRSDDRVRVRFSGFAPAVISDSSYV
jgi:hypothetical protein